jgi:hypothetical protein
VALWLPRRQLAIDGHGRCSAREDEESRKKNMTSGTHTSVKEEMICSEIYVFVYTAAGAKSSPDVFHGISVGNAEL